MPAWALEAPASRKDILNLVYICETVGLKQVADYWHSVRLPVQRCYGTLLACLAKQTLSQIFSTAVKRCSIM